MAKSVVRYIIYTNNGNLKLAVHRYSEYDHYEAEDRYFVNDNELFSRTARACLGLLIVAQSVNFG